MGCGSGVARSSAETMRFEPSSAPQCSAEESESAGASQLAPASKSKHAASSLRLVMAA